MHEGEEKSEDYLKAEALRKQAAKALTGISLKSKIKKQENAIELYEAAAGKFKLENAFAESAECFESILTILEDMKSTEDTETKKRNVMKECAEAYATNEDTDKARKMFYNCALLYKEIDKFYMAASVYQECAEMEMEERLPEKAMESWAEAADAYSTDGNLNKANHCYLKVADMKVQAEKYEESIALYEKVAQIMSKTAASRMQARPFLYTSALLRFAVAVRDGKDVKQVKKQVEDWCENYHGFKGEHEQLLLSATLDAFLTNDLGKFQSTLAKYDKQYKLKPLETKLFLIIKQKLTGEAGKADTGDDVEDLLS